MGKKTENFEKYKEFYDEWIKTYQNSLGKICSLPAETEIKEKLEKFISNAEGLNEQYRSWMSELETNTSATRDILQAPHDPEKYKEVYDQWMRSYEKIFDESLELPFKEDMKGIYGNMVFPDDYSEAVLQMSKLYKKSYQQICRPLNESFRTLLDKVAEISKGNAGPETYKEFYTLWMDSYKDTFGKYSHSLERENLTNLADVTQVYLGIYKGWIAALEKMSEKAKEISVQASDPNSFMDFYNSWLKLYDKAFETFFEDMPVAGGPMRDTIEPVKTMAKLYSDTFISMSKMWIGSFSESASVYSGKNKK